MAAAQAEHSAAIEQWRTEMDDLFEQRDNAAAAHAKAEAHRLSQLESERARYEKECADRDAANAQRNKELDELIANLGYGTPDAVEEYVSVVMSRSIYPEHFPVAHDFHFDPTTAELRLEVRVPGPEKIPNVKSYRYTRAGDTIASSALPQKDVKERYARAVHAIALRFLHEVFEADRRGLILTIALEVGAVTIDKATGKEIYVPLVAVAAERETFLGFDLSAVVPSATLEHLGAAVSKDPYSLIAADTGGIRTA